MKLIEKRNQKGWSRAELARRAGMHPSTVSLIESGRLVAYPSQLDKLALALDLPASHAPDLVGSTARPDQVGLSANESTHTCAGSPERPGKPGGTKSAGTQRRS